MRPVAGSTDPRSAASLLPRTRPIQDADLCAAVLGEPLTAYLAGADSVAELWSCLLAQDHLSTQPLAARLAVARHVILAFRAENRVSVAAAWLREVGAAGDDPPASLIRGKGDDEATAHTVLNFARDWLSHHAAA